MAGQEKTYDHSVQGDLPEFGEKPHTKQRVKSLAIRTILKTSKGTVECVGSTIVSCKSR